MKHTQGEWNVKSFNDSKFANKHIIYSSNGDTICRIMRDDNDNSEVELANAKLIASAPDLLINLQRLVERMEENDLGNSAAVNWAKEAIKKATE